MRRYYALFAYVTALMYLAIFFFGDAHDPAWLAAAVGMLVVGDLDRHARKTEV